MGGEDLPKPLFVFEPSTHGKPDHCTPFSPFSLSLSQKSERVKGMDGRRRRMGGRVRAVQFEKLSWTPTRAMGPAGAFRDFRRNCVFFPPCLSSPPPAARIDGQTLRSRRRRSLFAPRSWRETRKRPRGTQPAARWGAGRHLSDDRNGKRTLYTKVTRWKWDGMTYRGEVRAVQEMRSAGSDVPLIDRRPRARSPSVWRPLGGQHVAFSLSLADCDKRASIILASFSSFPARECGGGAPSSGLSCRSYAALTSQVPSHHSVQV